MSVQETNLTAIADAIREKDGTSEPIPANTFPERIRAIQSGGIELERIEIITPPVKTEYQVGETFDPAGLEVRAVYTNGAAAVATGWLCVPSAPLTEEDTKITVQYTEQGVTKTVEVEVSVAAIPEKIALNDYTWEEISQISNAGLGPEHWNVGDRKGILVNGIVGTLSINQTLYVYILGFDHNSAKEGNGIQFGTFKTDLSGGEDVCLTDSVRGGASTNGTKCFNMNHWGAASGNYCTNFGGWKGCDLRYDVLGSTKVAPSGYGSTPTASRVGYDAPADTATSPVANTLMAALPADLRAVMKPIAKYTDNKGNNSDVAANVTKSVDYLPLLSEYEVFGVDRSYANQFEKSYQAQYAYYAAGNSAMKCQHDKLGTYTYWHGRSPYYRDAHSFFQVNYNGYSYKNSSRFSNGLSAIFMV